MEANKLKSMADQLREFYESPEGKKHIEDFKRNEKLKQERINKWSMKIINKIKDISDDELHALFTRFLEWEEAYEELWYSRYVQTNSRIFGIITNVLKKIGDEFESDEDFYSGGWTYRGYTFKCYCGQGCFWRIIYKNETIFQSA
jgi:hypothetical protein